LGITIIQLLAVAPGQAHNRRADFLVARRRCAAETAVF
jgi:hypothetical protein